MCYLGFFIIQLLNLTYALDFDLLFYQTSDIPYGIPYGEWIVKYWNWWGNIPISESPAEEKVKYQCFMQIVDNVAFFVDPLQMHREQAYSCEIGSNNSIFLPLVASEYDTGIEGYEQATDEELVDSAEQDDNSRAFNVTIDGKVIPSEYIKKLRSESPFWNLTLVEGNIYEGKPGVFRAFAEGFYIFLKPLPEGSHQISYAAYSSESDSQTSLAGKITYNLFVK